MKFSAINFTCPSCGAPQKFSPATGKLTCEFCGTQTPIDNLNQTIHEYDFHDAVSTLEAEESKIIQKMSLVKSVEVLLHLRHTPFHRTVLTAVPLLLQIL